MAVDIHKLIATISPDTYCDLKKKAKVKDLVKKEGYLAAVEEAEVVKSEYMDFDKIIYYALLGIILLINKSYFLLYY